MAMWPSLDNQMNVQGMCQSSGTIILTMDATYIYVIENLGLWHHGGNTFSQNNYERELTFCKPMSLWDTWKQMNCSLPRVWKGNIPFFQLEHPVSCFSLFHMRLSENKSKTKRRYFKKGKEKKHLNLKTLRQDACKVQIRGPPIINIESQMGRRIDQHTIWILLSQVPSSFRPMDSEYRCHLIFYSLPLVLPILLSAKDKSQVSQICGFHWLHSSLAEQWFLKNLVVSESPSTSWFKSSNRLASEKEILILFTQLSSRLPFLSFLCPSNLQPN